MMDKEPAADAALEEKMNRRSFIAALLSSTAVRPASGDSYAALYRGYRATFTMPVDAHLAVVKLVGGGDGLEWWGGADWQRAS